MSKTSTETNSKRLRLGQVASALLERAGEDTPAALDAEIARLQARLDVYETLDAKIETLGRAVEKLEAGPGSEQAPAPAPQADVQELKEMMSLHLDCTNHWGREMCSQLTRIHIVLSILCAEEERAKSFIKEMEASRDVVQQHLTELSDVVQDRLGRLNQRGSQDREREEDRQLSLDSDLEDQETIITEREREGFER